MKIVDVTIGVLIFAALIGTIATTVATGSNLTGASLTLYLLVPLILVAMFIKGLSKGRSK